MATKMGSRRKTPKKPIKKKSRSSLKLKLDLLFSKYIRDRADNKCEYCGKTGRVECHHGVVHRRYMNTRYEPDNCIVLCGGCHRFFSDFPKINIEFFRKKIGSDRMEQLEILARSQVKPDLEQIEADLKVKIKKMEG
jgi:hypothetical protein